MSSSVIVSIGVVGATPALLIMTLKSPKCSTVFSTAAKISSRLATSAATTKASPPACSIFCLTSSNLLARRATKATAKPSFAKRKAIASPIPWPAPVTIATFFVMKNSTFHAEAFYIISLALLYGSC